MSEGLNFSHSSDINEIIKALSIAQSKIGKAELNCENPHLGSRYADLSSVWEACKGPLTDNGMCVTAIPVRAQPAGWELITTLWHTSGQFFRAVMPLKLEKDNMQGLGSAITYARRYSLGAMVGVTQEDDDGERSIDRDKRPQGASRQQSAPPQGQQQSRPAGQPAQKNAQNGQQNRGSQPNSAQNVHKPDPRDNRPPAGGHHSSEKPKQETPKFGDGPPPRLRGQIVKDIMTAAAALGIGQDLTPPDTVAGLEKEVAAMFEGKVSGDLTVEDLEKLLAKLQNDQRAK
jgi:hypothetical protein